MKKKDFLANTIVTFFGVGSIKFASGTWASLVSGALLFLVWPSLEIEWKGIATLLLFFIGWFYSDYVEKRDGSHDPSMIVIDEVVGMMITSILLPQIWWQWLIAFLAFRICDILKIWPASYFDKRKGGFSVMFDDVLMAILALFLTHLIISQI
jgi:phosphatidylglycerophosphatase A